MKSIVIMATVIALLLAGCTATTNDISRADMDNSDGIAAPRGTP